MNINIKYTENDIKNLIIEDLKSKGYNIIKTPEINVDTEYRGYGINEREIAVFKYISVEVDQIKE